MLDGWAVAYSCQVGIGAARQTDDFASREESLELGIDRPDACCPRLAGRILLPFMLQQSSG